ncbi:hypothetical protein NF867_14590 [Solitalea sp. MAHUQ-68]|uniref:Uncharacterized protein n=1 Tax=Solitalea agri TaxID=2953739 RepID=A0A9X2FC01_9SPHI|nr:hypothetical protein [Solitalea agri]MCO4294088.1 hypothetical protein [Solitalea agri]
MNLFSKLFNNSDTSESVILNDGLKLAMEFGKNWLQPIQDRLKKKYRFLTLQELNDYDTICRQAMHKGHDFVYNTLTELYDVNQTISNNELKEKLKKTLLDQYPWINTSNLEALFSQSCYYAWKDGLTKCIK